MKFSKYLVKYFIYTMKNVQL